MTTRRAAHAETPPAARKHAPVEAVPRPITRDLFTSVRLSSLPDACPEPSALSVAGALPPWLCGDLYRNGPGCWEPVPPAAPGAQRAGNGARHLFDGLALLHRFSVDGAAGAVTLRRAFLQSRALREARRGRTLREFGSDPATSVLGRLANLAVGLAGGGPFTDNANVAILPIMGALVATTEVPPGFIVDAHSLAVAGTLSGSPTARPAGLLTHVATIAAAHRLYVPARGEHVSIATHFAPPFAYCEVSTTADVRPGDGGAFGPVAPPAAAAAATTITGAAVAALNAAVAAASRTHRLPSAPPHYQHSFAATRDFAVLTEQPFVFSYARLAATLALGGPVTDMFEWVPARGTTFRAVDLATGAATAVTGAPPLFTLHHVNAYQRCACPAAAAAAVDAADAPAPARCCACGDREVVVDLIAYADPGILHEFSLERLRGGLVGGPRTATALRRFVLDLHARTCTEDDAALPVFDAASGVPLGVLGTHVYIELPSVHPGRVGAPYRYFWAVRAAPGAFADGIVAVDWVRRRALSWTAPGCTPTEPVFVPRPPGGAGAPSATAAENDGVLLSVVLEDAGHGDGGRSFLLVLDAATLAEVARAYLPGPRGAAHVPMTFHGAYVRASDGFGSAAAQCSAV